MRNPKTLIRSLSCPQIPNVECLCIAFMEDGKSIISGWSDGQIRAFGPQSGKLLYAITDAHVAGVTAIVGTSDSTKIVSGGKEGQVSNSRRARTAAGSASGRVLGVRI